ncbi:MAG: GPO family capsid scaffolding protein [Gammaproteobacteria bacterium]|nr:GPO family capsid scaffolding protein [Gammaproteobacteria bacterium]
MKFYKVAQAGKTIDGREITETQIQEMAVDYHPKTYASRVWLEHFRSIFPDGDFAALGDVLALKAEKDENGVMSLYAQIKPLPRLIEINKAKQKLFTSIEMITNFASTGKAYLVGLAVTDSPASLGTEQLCFSTQKQHNSVVSTYCETTFNDLTNDITTEDDMPKELEQKNEAENHNESADQAAKTAEQTPENRDEKPQENLSMLDKIKAMFSKTEKKVADSDAKTQELFHDIADSVGFGFAELQQQNQAQADKITELEQQFSELKKQLDSTPNNYSTRPPATGGNADNLTDC